MTTKKGTKGICYKEAVNNIHYFKEANKEKSFFFIGLNALSKSEEIVIQELLEQNNSSVFWDIDKEFLKTKTIVLHILLENIETNGIITARTNLNLNRLVLIQKKQFKLSNLMDSFLRLEMPEEYCQS